MSDEKVEREKCDSFASKKQGGEDGARRDADSEDGDAAYAPVSPMIYNSNDSNDLRKGAAHSCVGVHGSRAGPGNTLAYETLKLVNTDMLAHTFFKY